MMADDIMGVEMIKIDTKLFITCRLCLEENGVYQIVPSVQLQIKYCFDIHVEPFDGLPQLLCEKCKSRLDEYSSQKKKYIEKQQELIMKLKVKQVQQSKSEDRADARVQQSKSEDRADARVSSSSLPVQQSDLHSATPARSRSRSLSKEPINTTVKDHELEEQPASVMSVENSAYDSDNNIKVIKPPKRKRKNRLLSNSSSGNEVSIVPKKKKRKRSKSPKWSKKYKKYFVCNFCTNTYTDQHKLKKHFNAHYNIKSKYNHILKNPGFVKLCKLDGKSNAINSDNTNLVMFDEGRIIKDEGYLYHVLYTGKDADTRSLKKKSKELNADSSKRHDELEDSDDDFIVSLKNKQRISRSSNETVVLEDTNKTQDNSRIKPPVGNVFHYDCINIDDSSDNNTDVNDCDNSNQTANIKIESKTIENIISNCRLKYMKKLELSQNGDNNTSKKGIYSETQLQHKLLSIGRKNITKDGHFNCTGLLRFMEHKNLNIHWLPKDNRESLVRIMAKLKTGSDNDTTIEKSGWITLPETEGNAPNERSIHLPNDVVDNIVAEFETENNFSNEPAHSDPITAIVTGASIINTESVVTTHPLPLSSFASAVLYKDTESDLSSKKILNAWPVANPKQLPKKSNKSFVLDVDDDQTRQLVEDENYSIPIITSTTSLAEVKKDEKEAEPAKALEKSLPRIKVKPVSELMNLPNASSEHTKSFWRLNNTSQGESFLQLVPQMQPQIHSVQSLHKLPVIAPKPDRNMPSLNRSSETTTTSSTESVVLNSVELPNTKTDSPFKYLKSLLLLHNIHLLDPDIRITSEYIGLLKIKVQFKQESKDVILCLSLFCNNNMFCICIKNSFNADIPIPKISAVWQWEIIKIFQGDLANKILNNAGRAGQMVYTNTKTFLSVLKSVTCN